MRNFIQTGERMDFTAATNIASGAAVRVGTKIGIATTDIANGQRGSLAMDGVFTLPKLGTDVVAQGAALYWDNTNSRLTLTATGNTYAGYAVAAAGSGATTVQIRINR